MFTLKKVNNMEIKYNKIETITIDEFADRHGLVLEVNEREPLYIKMPHIGENGRFYAYFGNIEISDGRFLTSAFGNGSTIREAIEDYAYQLSHTTVKNGNTGGYIDVPHLTLKRGCSYEG
jgi:hypothetical protein